MNEQPNVVVVGAGAIGSSVAGWLAPKCRNLSLLARGESLEVIRNCGLKSYLKGGRSSAQATPIHAIASLAEISTPEVIIVTVKNYDLETVSRDLRAQLRNHEPILVALQNGVENQKILPRFFSRVVYGVVCYNAWREAPGEVGHEPRGYVILGTPSNDLREETQMAAGILGLGLTCPITDRLQDAAHCKLVINLANALMTLVGVQKRPIESVGVLAHMTLLLYREGIQLLQASGFHEHSLGRVPSWRSIRTGAALPAFVSGALYRLNAGRLGLNSTAQDVYGGRSATELETLNGYMLDLAKQTGFATPINETVYQVAKERFGPDFRPVTERELWGMVNRSERLQMRKDTAQVRR